MGPEETVTPVDFLFHLKINFSRFFILYVGLANPITKAIVLITFLGKNQHSAALLRCTPQVWSYYPWTSLYMDGTAIFDLPT